MLKSVLLKLFPTILIFSCIISEGMAASTTLEDDKRGYEQFSTARFFSDTYRPDKELSLAIQSTYDCDPRKMTYANYLNYTQSYYCENHPNLTADPRFKFDVFNTPVACVVFPQVVDSKTSSSLMGMAIPSVNIGSLEYYTTLGLAGRFEHLEKSTDGYKDNTFLLIKVSVSAKLFESSEKDKLKDAIYQITYKALSDLLSTRTLIAFDETDPKKTSQVELTADALKTGKLKPVLIYSPLKDGAFRHGVPYAN